MEVILTKGPDKGPVSYKVIVKKKPYSDPKLYIPKVNGKPTLESGKAWYVSFYWRSETGKLDKKFKFKKGINQQKTVKARKELGKALVKAYQEALDRGWNPETKSISKKRSSREDFMSVEKALHYALQIKKSGSKKLPTLTGYEFHMNRFLEWCKVNGYLGFNIKDFSVDHFYEFHDWLRFDYLVESTQEPLTGTSINNHKRSLSALFTTLKNERMIPVNFIRDIPMVDQEPVNNKAFTAAELVLLKDEMQKSDPALIPFFSFILYPLLRPVEICRLKINSFNTEKWLFSVQTKTEVLSYKRIIEKIKPVLEAMEIEKYPGSFYLFTNKDQPADWDVPEKSKADHFGKRFKKIKDVLGFGREYGLYSGRHTAIMDLYNAKVGDGMGEMEIMLSLMPHTGHKSIAGIKNYLRKHKQSIAADHSDLYTIDF